MRKLTSIIIIAFFSCVGFAQAHLGTILKPVNLRDGAGVEHNVIALLEPKTQVFIITLEAENSFYNVIDIITNEEGYINKAYVKVGQEIKKSEGNVFAPQGSSSDENSHVNIFNNTEKTLTLKMNSDMYYFQPHEKKVLTFDGGDYSFRASAPGVIPYIGDEFLKNTQDYSWQFYIVRR